MDSLLMYECSSSSSDGEGEIKADPRLKISAMGETPVVVSVDSDHNLDVEALRWIGAEKATSEDSNAQADEMKHLVQRASMPQIQITQTKATQENAAANWTAKRRRLWKYATSSHCSIHTKEESICAENR